MTRMQNMTQARVQRQQQPEQPEQTHSHIDVEFAKISTSEFPANVALTVESTETQKNMFSAGLEARMRKPKQRRQQRRSALPKRKWTDQENEKLRKLVMRNGPQHWAIIAKHFEGRVAKQCRARWFNHLSPDVSKEAWTEAEDTIIYRLHKRLGNQWSEISKSLSGRTGYGIKNRYNGTIRRLRSLNQSDEPLDVEKVTLKDFLLVNHCAYGRSRLVEPPRNQESSVDILEIGVNTFSPHKRSRLEPAMESVSQRSDKGRTKAKNSGLDTLAAVVGLQKLSYTSEAKETHDYSPRTTVDDFESEKVVRQIELIKYFRRQCLALQSRFQLLQQQHIALQEQYRVHFGGKSVDLNPGFARDLTSISSIKGGTSSK